MNYEARLARSGFLLCSFAIACGSSNAPPSEGTGTGGARASAGGAGISATSGGVAGANAAGAFGVGGSSSGGSAGALALGGAVGAGGSLVVTSGTGNIGAGGKSGTGGALNSAGGSAAATGGASAGSGAANANGGAGAGANGGSSSLSVPARLSVTGVRGVATPAASTALSVHNGSPNPVSITRVALNGSSATLFALAGAPTTPAVVAPGSDLSFTIQLLTASAALPAAPPQNSGAAFLSATLDFSFAGGSAQTLVSGLVLTTATHEPTLGQILNALGYKLNVGAAQNDANPNSGGATALPGVEPGTDEIAAQLFQKAGSGNVGLEAVARFSPKGPMPYGWYPMGAAATRNVVGTMAEITDPQTSDKARMVSPPLTGATSFDPGGTTFGIWVYSDQLSQKYDTGGTATNGDYDYSEDAPNSPANVHRTKVYPLKNASGVGIANSYLLAVEEAANGDYQDYVFVLTNAKVAP